MRRGVASNLVELAAFAAVEDVDAQADDEPDEEADPGDRGQAGHQQQAAKDAEDGEDGAAHEAEGAVTFGLLAAQDEDSDGYQDEGEQCTDVGHLGQAPHVKYSCRNRDEDAGDDGGEGRCTEARVNFAEGVGQQAVARHGEPDARLAVLADQDGGDHAHEGADEDEEPDEVEAVSAGFEREALERVDDRGSVASDRAPRDYAGQHQRYSEVKDGADDQCGDDADGDIALRVLALFAGGGDGVEADVGEENDGAAGEDSGEAVGHERMIVAGVNERDAEKDEREDGGDLDQHHDVIGAGGLADAEHQDDGEDEDDEECGEVEAAMPAREEDVVAGEVLQALRKKGGREPLGIQVDAEPVEQIDDVGREADRDAHVGEGVFEDEVPADDPGDEFAKGRIGVRVGRPGDGDHRGEFGVAEAGERAEEGDED